MTIVRLGQLHAENRVVTPLSYFVFLPTITSAQARTGTYSYDMGYGTGPFGFGLSSGISAGRLSYWQRMGNSVISNTAVIYYCGDGLGMNVGDNHIAIRINSSTGMISITRPNGNSSHETLASTTIPSQYSATGTWFHVGITHNIHATTGFISVYVDGVQILNYTGDTRPSYWNGSSITYASSSIHWFGPGGAASSGTQGFQDAFIDDMFLDSIVGESDSPVPGRGFLPSLPDGVGADDDWTADPAVDNYLNVDDNPNDGETTVNKATSANLRDTFTYSNISLPTDYQIVAVIVEPFVKRLDTEVANGISVHCFDGSNYEDSADLDLTMSFSKPVFARFPLQPDSSPWDETDFNAMQFGYRSRGTF